MYVIESLGVSIKMIKDFLKKLEGFNVPAIHYVCMSYSACCEVESSLNLDKILCAGDTVYQHVINRLKAQAKFIHLLLSLEEIPDDFEVGIGKFTV